MIELTLTHEFECSPERFWELFFDPEFTREMIVEGLGFASCEIEEVQKRDDKRYRDMRVVPKIDVPGPVAKLLGPRLYYTEHGVFDEKTQVWDHHMELSVLSDRIRLGGKVPVEPLGDERCRRIADLWAEAKILGIGKMVERAAEKNMRAGWSKGAEWMNRWIKAHD